MDSYIVCENSGDPRTDSCRDRFWITILNRFFQKLKSQKNLLIKSSFLKGSDLKGFRVTRSTKDALG